MTDTQPTESREQPSRHFAAFLGRLLTRPWLLSKRPLFGWLMTAYVAAVAGAMVFVFVSNAFSRLEFSDQLARAPPVKFQDLVEFQDLVRRLDELEQLVVELPTGPETGPSIRTLANGDTVTDSATLSRIDVLEDSLTALHEDHQTLRTALNPTDPTAILTVLRLGDKFELLTNELDSIRTNLDDTKRSVDQRIQQNYESTTKLVDAVTSTIGWMALLLVPILLNAVRAFLPRKSQDTEATPGARD